MKKIITALALFVAVSTSTITSFARSAPCPSCGKMMANSVTTVVLHAHSSRTPKIRSEEAVH